MGTRSSDARWRTRPRTGEAGGTRPRVSGGALGGSRRAAGAALGHSSPAEAGGLGTRRSTDLGRMAAVFFAHSSRLGGRRAEGRSAIECPPAGAGKEAGVPVRSAAAARGTHWRPGEAARIRCSGPASGPGTQAAGRIRRSDHALGAALRAVGTVVTGRLRGAEVAADTGCEETLPLYSAAEADTGLVESSRLPWLGAPGLDRAVPCPP